MSIAAFTPASKPAPVTMPEALLFEGSIRAEIEQFLYFEAELLDDRRFTDWYTLCADDIYYWMPLRRNRLLRELPRENTTVNELAHFDENKKSLGWRVGQIATGMHWAEDPPSRTRHLVSNVRVTPTEKPDEYGVRSNFLCYRNRLEDEVDIWAGERRDILRRAGERQWQIARRTILLDQNTILSKNLAILF
jgi:3-phenylpropionate/cinnamic acid dioxygenase small subunit